ncbi:MAG: class I SAM-dependent methyltransferase [Sarcina sp.]
MSENVKKFYDENCINELNRLDDPYNRIEFFSTLYMIKKYFPKEGTIFDIGSGPGRYSLELLKKNYDVTMMDISANSITLAKNNIESSGFKAKNYICGDARHLNFELENQYDGILLLGPMYHIQEKKERINLLKECKRILKPNGVIIISYINTLGILKVGVSDFYKEFTDLDNIYNYFFCSSYDSKNSFTDIYCTTSEEAIEEVIDSDLEILSYAGAESFLSGMMEKITSHYINEREVYLNLLKVAVEKCEMKEFRDATEHLLIVAKK